MPDFPRHLVDAVEGELPRALAALLGDADDLAPFHRALAYPLAAGGKRLRPALVLAAAEALGAAPATALPAAVAIELVHTFSLVHDDLPILDDDDLRRGRATTHVVFGDDVALLVGDGLLTLAMRALAEAEALPAERRLRLVAELARATDGMIRGQYLDVRPSDAVGEAELVRLSSLKTGCLLEASLVLGAVAAGADAGAEQACRALGREVGVGFQIVDDVLDATGTDATLGKTAGSDAANGRRTYVTVLGLERAQALATASQARALALVDELDRLPGDATALRAIVRRVYVRDR